MNYKNTSILIALAIFNVVGQITVSINISSQNIKKNEYPIPVWRSINIYAPQYLPSNRTLLYDFVKNIRLPGGSECARYWGNCEKCLTYQDDCCKNGIIDTTHPFFRCLDSIFSWNIYPTIAFGAVPRDLSRSRGYLKGNTGTNSKIVWRFNAIQDQYAAICFRYFASDTLKGELKTDTEKKAISFPKTKNIWRTVQVQCSSTGLSFVQLNFKKSLRKVEWGIDNIKVDCASKGSRLYEAEFAQVQEKCGVDTAFHGFSSGKQGFFGTNLTSAQNLQDYRKYIKSLFSHLKTRYTSERISKCNFILFEEADNTGNWDGANTGSETYDVADIKAGNEKNLDEYCILFDYALAGMRDAGISNDLYFTELSDPLSPWADALVKFMAGKSSIDSTPRLKYDSLHIQYSRYFDIGVNPKELITGFNDHLIHLAEKYLPGVKIRISIAQCGLYPSASSIGGISNDGAALYASIFKTANDLDMSYCTGWFYKTWGDQMLGASTPEATANGLWNGQKTAAYNLISFLERLEQHPICKMQIQNTAGPIKNEDIDGLCTINSTRDSIKVLLYNYDPDKKINNRDGEKRVLIRIINAYPFSLYNLDISKIDEKNNNFFNAWMARIDSVKFKSNVPNWNCLSEPMAPNNLASGTFFNEWRKIRGQLTYVTDPEKKLLKSDKNGLMVFQTGIAPNTVSFMEFYRMIDRNRKKNQ